MSSATQPPFFLRTKKFDDGHRDTAYRYGVSLPMIAAALT